MKRRSVALFHSPWPAAGLARPPSSKPLAQYRYAVWYKANPRTADYMRALQRERFADAEWVDTNEHPDWTNRISQADVILLLYPDSIGLGFAPIERAVRAHKLEWATVEVFNGRRRQFRLNGVTCLGLRMRRLLEWSMLPELLLLPAFIVATPLLWLFDALRGRT
jgi:hypothetical protein